MTSEKVIHLDDGCYVRVYLIFLMQIYAFLMNNATLQSEKY